jgi:methionyl-tRNA formyltransferase
LVNITLFTANLLGLKVLEKLDNYSFYPQVITFHKNFQRTSLSRNFSEFYKKFPMKFISANKYSQIKNELGNIETPYTLCIDWKKDFFSNEKLSSQVFFSHPSLLPMYRGYGAITEQFLKGVVISGITFYEPSDKIDSGKIVFQEKIIIDYNDYPLDFFDKLADKAAEFILKLNDLGIKAFEFKSQNENDAFYLVRQRTRNSIIDFNRDAYSLYNHIRAYSKPFFGAFFNYKGEKIIVWKAYTEKWQGNYGNPGKVLRKNDNGIEISVGQGTIIFTEIEKNGKIYKNHSIPFIEKDNLVTATN